jgi:hypothetical protein
MLACLPRCYCSSDCHTGRQGALWPTGQFSFYASVPSPVSEAVCVQVVDVCHVDGVLKHTPVATLKLNLTIHCRHAGRGTADMHVSDTRHKQLSSRLGSPPVLILHEPHKVGCFMRKMHPINTASNTKDAAACGRNQRFPHQPSPALHCGSSSSGVAGIGGRSSAGMALLPWNSHTKPSRSSTSYEPSRGRLGQLPCSAEGTSRACPLHQTPSRGKGTQHT